MSENLHVNNDGYDSELISDFTERAYLDYAMYVILDRALPHIADGLKPVQRRIVYAMSELGLKNSAKYKKSARTVGDVLGKFHPHGDSACYEAMVLMAQNFSYRYPLIDGQGNWGSPDDPKSFAAMRYTESRLAKYAEALLAELSAGAASWKLNFDGTLEEPELLPAQLPNVILNGSTGIAVGMATDIPPHNIGEVIAACLHLIDNPEASIAELLEYIKGPDSPAGAEINTSKEELLQMYTTGNGSFRMRASYSEQKEEIVITAIPHQVSSMRVLEQIAAQMNAKKLPQIVDLRDDSDHENPIRIVLVSRSNRVNTEEVMSHLFATTDLQKNYRVNMNMIGINGLPQVKNLALLLNEWLSYRKSVIKKRLAYRLDIVDKRLHILDGLLIAYLNIDQVIKIIRTEDKPKPKLMKKFKLSDKQAEAILDLKLRHLAKLEEFKIKGEQDELAKEKNKIEELLKSDTKLKKLMAKELKALAEQFGDERKSQIVERAHARAKVLETQVPSEAVTVVISKKGWVRAGRSHEINGEALTYKAGDGFLAQALGRTNQQAVFIDTTGRSYALGAHSLPSIRTHGEPITAKVSLPDKASVTQVLLGKPKTKYLLITDLGYGFITAVVNMTTKNKAGKALIKLGANTQLLTPHKIQAEENEYIAFLSKSNRLLIIALTDIAELAKGRGNKLIAINTKAHSEDKDKVISTCLVNDKDNLNLCAKSKKHKLKPKQWLEYVGDRGERGKTLPKKFTRVIEVKTQ